MNSVEGLRNAHSPPMARSPKSSKATPFADTGGRVRLVRMAVGESNAAAFAARIGISPTNFSNIESGNYDLSKLVAIKMVRAIPGLSLDWLFLGNTDRLSYELARKIAEAAAKSITER